MKVFTTKKAVSDFLTTRKLEGAVIGFVPTMGALHEGHLSLIRASKADVELTVCSIFVNPTQFNDPEDLKRYPRPVEADMEKLIEVGCDVLFMPDVKEMYPEDESWHIDLGNLENVLEGKFRPGHYQGVTQIVKKLFDIIHPDIAYFGQKDFQQFMVIDRMVKLLGVPVRLKMVPIVREEDGLAMSSRNMHLSDQERKHALALSQALNLAQAHFHAMSIEQLKAEAEAFLQTREGVKLEYFEISDAETLQPASSKDTKSLVALVAAYVGKTRLIDNLILK